MKKFKLTAFSLLIILTQACVKDRVPNPTSLNTPQTLFFTENFDEVSTVAPALPTGWSSSPSTGGWQTDSATANASNAAAIGYSGGSGGNNVVISNPTSGNGGTFTLTSKSISTLHYQNISVIFAARRSKHFSDNGSAISDFSYSVDGGQTWTKVNYTEVSADSDWHLDNNGARMSLGANANNQASIIFRWDADVVVTTSGTYRIDDLQVYGTGM